MKCSQQQGIVPQIVISLFLNVHWQGQYGNLNLFSMMCEFTALIRLVEAISAQLQQCMSPRIATQNGINTQKNVPIHL